MLSEIPIWIKILSSLVGLIGAFIGLNAAYKKYSIYKKRLVLLQDNIENIFIGQFNKIELNQALSGYVIPHCAPGDPSNKDGEEFLADVRESIFEYMDRSISKSAKSYHLILADTGMGKTSFCLNYYVHIKQKMKEANICLVSLAAGDAVKRIEKIENKSNCIIIADAFDEDPMAAERGKDRLNEILESSADFRAVIITCRSQYFMSDDTIPRETPMPKLVPRGLNQSPNYGLVRSYISPFSTREIEKYIDGHFPIWKMWKIKSRFRAFKLSRSIPDLAYRPMLLERLPDLVKDEEGKHELYQLYDYMVEGWLKRESKWIPINDLRNVSFELAIYIYEGLPKNASRITKEQIEYVSENKLGVNPNWKHLTARSLLNRDSQGRFKFAHKSILEFLLVKLATEGDDRPLEYKWTPFMKELFISWGHSSNSESAAKRAQDILSSYTGRSNIAPLYDLWATPATSGLPDFKRSTERRLTHWGVRLAPPAWRENSLEIIKRPDRSGWNIYDSDFNLRWLLVDSYEFKKAGIQENVGDILKMVQLENGYHLPSYDQFVALVEGLSFSKSRIIKDGESFLLSDRPTKRGHLIATLGNNHRSKPGLKVVDKER